MFKFIKELAWPAKVTWYALITVIITLVYIGAFWMMSQLSYILNIAGLLIVVFMSANLIYKGFKYIQNLIN